MFTKIFLTIFLFVMSKADICPRTDAIDLGSYKAWKKHDNLPLVKNEKIDISVVLDDNRAENYNWEFDLDVVNNYNDKKCFMLKSDKSPAEIGSDKFKKRFAKRIITVELKNTNFDIEVLNIRNGLKRVSLKNNIINVKAVIENVNKLVLHKIDKIPGTNVEEEHASQILDRNSWVSKMGKLRFRVLGREPIISREHIKLHKVFIDDDKFCIFDGDVIEEMDIVSERSCSAYGLDWTCKYDDPKKHKGWHCDLKISDNKNLARESVKDLRVEFVLCKNYSSMNTNQNSKIKTTLLKRRLFKEKIKEESPLALFCTLFLFVSLFLFGYFAFLFYIGDIGNRAKMFTSVERTKMSPIRRFFFPIYMSELTKVLPLCFLMVCTVFVYSTYRDIKDSMVVGAADEFYLKAGNVMTNWLKMFGVLPCALIFMTVLMNLTQRYRFPTVFYGVTAFFGFYFVLNALVLYPNRKILTVMPIVNWMKELDPDSMLSTFGGGAAGIFAFPVTSLHYIMSELWGTVTLSFLAWGYTNIITKREDASRWYPQVALLAQIGQIIAGSSVGELATSYKENYNKCLLYLNCLTAVLTALFGLTCFWLDQFVMQMPRFRLNSEGSTTKKKKEKVGLCAGIKYAINDGYVFCLSGIVFAYGAIMVCMELTYKDTYCSQFFWDKSKMTVFKGMETMLTGVLTLSAMMFIGSNLLNWFGWLFTALFTPVVAGIFCILFYIICSTTNIATYQLLFIDGRIAMKNAGTGSSLAWICAYLGMAMCVFIKSFKYATLDPTKEIAYLPLSKSEKSKAKAIVDIVGARAGKSAGALFNIFFTSIIGGGSALTTPMKIVSFIFSMVLLFLWVASAYSLDKHIQTREKNNKEKNEEMKSDLESGNVNQKSKLKADTRN